MAAKGGPVKRLAFFLALAWGFVPLAGQQNPGRSPRDLILLLDTSASMSGSYREVRDYITGPFLKEYLRLGDTFHIISFSDKPRLEIARRIEGQGDLETVIGRMLLLYPLEPGSDIAGALAYLETYVSRLSPLRPKKAVLLSDGETVPELPGAGGLENLIGETKNRLAGQNAGFDFVSVPLQPRSAPSPVNTSPPRQPAPSAAAPPASQPEIPARIPPAAASSGISPPVPEPPADEPSFAAQEEDSPAPGASSQPAGAPPAVAGGAGFEPPAAPDLPPSPAPPPPIPSEIRASDRPVEPAAAPAGSAQTPSFPFILLALPAFGIPGFALFFLNRRLGVSPNRAVARAADLPAVALFPAKPETDTLEAATLGENAGSPPCLDGRPLMLNLFVEDQNTFIGKRNVHVVKPGVNFTIGGGRSDFLIFLVPMPSRIADLRYQGDSCLLIPRKPKYFPDTGSSPVKDCIGKTIRVVSDKDYELFIRIDLCEDPLAALNRLMNAI